jgi:hypothetical protein
MLLINNELIWISIPRCASVSLINSFESSDLKIKKSSLIEPFIKDSKNNLKHYHLRKSECINEFGIKETFCINRNWFDRWMSAIEFFFDVSKNTHKNELITDWKDIDNEFVYKHFNTNFANAIYSENPEPMQNCYNNLFTKINKNLPGTLYIFNSKNYWTENEKCTYEFDITELDKFADFIYQKFNVKLKIEKTNETKKQNNKIIVNDELKNFLWNTFELRFQKKINLI